MYPLIYLALFQELMNTYHHEYSLVACYAVTQGHSQLDGAREFRKTRRPCCGELTMKFYARS